jgi:hypothetical protein
MAFITIEGFRGKIFVPDDDPSIKRKRPCRDCFACQFCGDDRCAKCVGKSLKGNCNEAAQKKEEKKSAGICDEQD